ncbi:MAG: hypothetical protein NT075_34870 [Chloroflexi bacterium]|nr:hypothetical protein [Chloroflexota bacterium]
MNSTTSIKPDAFNFTPTPFNISLKVWLGLVAFLVLVKTVITFFPTTFRSVEQASVFAWPALGIWAILGLIGVWFAHKTGFPSAWDGHLSNKERLWIPIAIGLAYAVFEVAFDLLTGYSRFEIALHHVTKINIDFPASVLIYPGGAVIVEVIYRLFLIPVLLWLISTLLFKGRWQTQIFWGLAILTSCIEPLTQDLEALQLGTVMLSAVLLKGFGLNILQVALFRKYGFLTAILLRIAFYLIWHVVYVH